jgi:hypothetical protein
LVCEFSLQFTAASKQRKQIAPVFFFTDATTLVEQEEGACRAALSQNNSFCPFFFFLFFGWEIYFFGDTFFLKWNNLSQILF